MKKVAFICLAVGMLLTGCSMSDVGKSEKTVSNKIATEGPKGQTDEGKNTAEATVVRVVDGDTFTVNLNGTEEKIRLLLIDTPETKHPNKPVEEFGKEASDFTNSILTVGKIVKLEFDVAQRDRYGRLLAYVYVDGVMLNELLLEKGLARLAVYPPNTKYVDEFGALQENAQEAGVGIWSVENYTKSEIVSQNCEDPNIKGNINSKGEKIYHVPSGQYYDITIAEEYFCSEEYAKEAGYRKSQR